MTQEKQENWFLYCPLSHQLLTDAVEAGDGHIYQKMALAAWLQHHPESPLTGAQLKDTPLIEVPWLRRHIQSVFAKEGQEINSLYFEQQPQLIQDIPRRSSVELALLKAELRAIKATEEAVRLQEKLAEKQQLLNVVASHFQADLLVKQELLNMLSFGGSSELCKISVSEPSCCGNLVQKPSSSVDRFVPDTPMRSSPESTSVVRSEDSLLKDQLAELRQQMSDLVVKSEKERSHTRSKCSSSSSSSSDDTDLGSDYEDQLAVYQQAFLNAQDTRLTAALPFVQQVQRIRTEALVEVSLGAVLGGDQDPDTQRYVAERGLRDLISAIRINTSIRRLDLTTLDFCDVDHHPKPELLVELSEALEARSSSQSLTHLRLRPKLSSDMSGFEALIKSVFKQGLSNIYVDWRPFVENPSEKKAEAEKISTEVAIVLGRLMPESELNGAYVRGRLTAKGLQELCDGVVQSKLSLLSLEETDLGPWAVPTIGRMILSARCLRFLSIAHNHFGDQGIQDLWGSVRELGPGIGAPLEKLEFVYNDYEKKTGESLKKLLVSRGIGRLMFPVFPAISTCEERE